MKNFAIDPRIKRILSIWMDKKGIPQDVLYDLEPYDVNLLHEWVCIGNLNRSYEQMRGLYSALNRACHSRLYVGSRIKSSSWIEVGDPGYDELVEFFSRLHASEQLDYREKF